MSFDLVAAQARQMRGRDDIYLRRVHEATDRDALVADLTKAAARTTAATERRDKTEAVFKRQVQTVLVAQHLEVQARARLALYDAKEGSSNA